MSKNIILIIIHKNFLITDLNLDYWYQLISALLRDIKKNRKEYNNR